MPIDHWMMFGTFAEQRHFVYPAVDTYRGAIINGNMAAHAPDGLAAFLLERTASLRYIIDPLTHAFQHDPDFITGKDGEAKSSIKALAEIYGDPTYSTVGKRPILPEDFANDVVLREFVRRCLDFQSRRLADLMRDSDAMKYLEEDEVPDLEPYALVAPYFYMTETTYEDWLPVAVRAGRHAKAEYPQAKLFASVVLSQGLILDKAARKTIVRELVDEDFSGYLLWVDNLDEQAAGGAELKALLAVARDLRVGGEREVINLHGGYFSVLAAGVLGKEAMTGVTHGPEFGEFRSVVPVGGGIPIARYYIPLLHARVRYRDAIRFLDAKKWFADVKTFHRNVCDCAECRETLDGDIANFVEFGKGTVRNVRRSSGIARIEYPTTETKLHCLRHYLQRKAREYQFAATASRDQILDDLRHGHAEFKKVVGLEGVSHLSLWEKTLAPPVA
jgi:hypothetical protein